MKIPVHVLNSGIDPGLYRYNPHDKGVQISYIERKSESIGAFKKLLRSRNPDFIDKIKWAGLNALKEEEYAAQICKSSIFVNLSTAEGLVTSSLEAMLAGTIVAGFDSIGGQGTMIGEGEAQNSILAQNGDYVTLAYKIEPLLADLLSGDMKKWHHVIKNGIETGSKYKPGSEERSVIDFWSNV